MLPACSVSAHRLGSGAHHPVGCRCRPDSSLVHHNAKVKPMILIAYDGSDDAKSAIEHASTLLPGSSAIVLTIWEPFLTMMIHAPRPGAGRGSHRHRGHRRRLPRVAQARAEEGAQLARDAGIDASARVVARSGSIAEAISRRPPTPTPQRSSSAHAVTGVKSLLLGSVSTASCSIRPVRACRPLARGRPSAPAGRRRAGCGRRALDAVHGGAVLASRALAVAPRVPRRPVQQEGYGGLRPSGARA